MPRNNLESRIEGYERLPDGRDNCAELATDLIEYCSLAGFPDGERGLVARGLFAILDLLRYKGNPSCRGAKNSDRRDEYVN
ncbi:hypothetical protein D6817_00685 [Candidatus Pacearchaeota archaeon]|nr:MAG: hypothetical protein D6817_00685 [Candidatus Pacearchaeota archaeon]